MQALKFSNDHQLFALFPCEGRLSHPYLCDGGTVGKDDVVTTVDLREQLREWGTLSLCSPTGILSST